MSTLSSFPRGVFVGAVLMYYLDPRRGRARRARFVNFVTHLGRDEGRLLGKGARDAQHRAAGAVERLRHPLTGEVDDDVLVARVRARLGHVTPNGHSIAVVAHEGRITLRGPVLAREAEDVIREVRHVPGVVAVEERLDRHVTADVPSLQRRPSPRADGRWTPSVRAGAVIGGAGLVAWGLVVRRGAVGLAAAAAGALLALRGSRGAPIGTLAGVDVHKTITVHASIDRVFDLWRRVDNFPRFMHHVEKIQVDKRAPERSRWFVEGPAGTSLAFDAVMTKFDQHREIAWRTLPHQVIEHAGHVKFTPVLEGTRVEVHLTYRPPGGALGHAFARLLGWDPKARIDDDLVRMKALLEDGQTRAHGRRVDVRDVQH